MIVCQKEELMNEFDKNKQELIDAALLTLGWIAATHGFDSDPVLWLAKALEKNGCESDYIRRILLAPKKDI